VLQGGGFFGRDSQRLGGRLGTAFLAGDPKAELDHGTLLSRQRAQQLIEPIARELTVDGLVGGAGNGIRDDLGEVAAVGVERGKAARASSACSTCWTDRPVAVASSESEGLRAGRARARARPAPGRGGALSREPVSGSVPLESVSRAQSFGGSTSSRTWKTCCRDASRNAPLRVSGRASPPGSGRARNPTVLVAPSNRHDQAKVRLDHALLRPSVAALNALG
jgi:hypothetical protein